MYCIGKRLETYNWKLIICVENYVASKGWSLLQAQDPSQGMMTIIDQSQELLLVNHFPIGRNIIIGKGVEVRPIGDWGMMQ